MLSTILLVFVFFFGKIYFTRDLFKRKENLVLKLLYTYTVYCTVNVFLNIDVNLNNL